MLRPFVNLLISRSWNDLPELEKELGTTEWKVDADGRPYRKIGDCIEYATQFITTRGSFYEVNNTKGIKKHG